MAVLNEHNYHDEQNKQNILKMRAVLETLPPFCKTFFRGIEEYTSARTRLAYAYDIRLFFEYLHEQNALCRKIEIRDFPFSILDELTHLDIEEYLEYMSLYQKDGKDITNAERGKSRKLAALRSFYNYFYKAEMLKNNPAALVSLPKLHDKAIIRLDVDETARLLDFIEHGGDGLTGQKKVYYEKTKERDLAIVTLLLGTGIRVSECVGLDLNDVSFKNYGLRVVRKGGNESMVYFGDEVSNALLDYLEIERPLLAEKTLPGHENALFLSLKYSRLTTRAVEKLVKKYTGAANINKKITPHKLRSTYGTNLYKETGDIYLVADALGHKSVETTRQHYAAIDDERRKLAGKFSGSIFQEDH